MYGSEAQHITKQSNNKIQTFVNSSQMETKSEMIKKLSPLTLSLPRVT